MSPSPPPHLPSIDRTSDCRVSEKFQERHNFVDTLFKYIWITVRELIYALCMIYNIYSLLPDKQEVARRSPLGEHKRTRKFYSLAEYGLELEYENIGWDLKMGIKEVYNHYVRRILGKSKFFSMQRINSRNLLHILLKFITHYLWSFCFIENRNIK